MTRKTFRTLTRISFVFSLNLLSSPVQRLVSLGVLFQASETISCSVGLLVLRLALFAGIDAGGAKVWSTASCRLWRLLRGLAQSVEYSAEEDCCRQILEGKEWIERLEEQGH